MQELINKLSEKVGLSADQAKQSVETVMDFVKGKLPAPLADKVEAMFGGAEGEKIEFGGLMESIGAMFGGAKDNTVKAMDGAEEIFDKAKDKAEDMMEDAKEKAEEFFGEATEKLEDLGDAANEMAKDALGKIKGIFGGKK